MSFLKKLFNKKDQPTQSYEDFWNWFQKNERAFYYIVKEHHNIEKDFFDELSLKLNEIKDGFYYLTGMYNDDTVELVLTADGAIKNIVFVEELIGAAPEIKGWLFTALKPALNIEDVNIEMAGYEFSSENLSFYSNDHADYPDEIDITIVHHDLNEENKSTITNGTYIFLDNYLGELHFVTTIDSLDVISKTDAQKELVSIDKLKDFLTWRQKELIEKYEGIKWNTENDSYSLFEANLENGSTLIALINTDLLEWDGKTSHPWILNIEIKYDGTHNNGIPNKRTLKILENIEDKILEELKDYGGYLYIGRQTADNIRKIYFACKDFRKPSKVLFDVQNKYADNLEIGYDIYKDKYWQSFNRFTKRF